MADISFNSWKEFSLQFGEQVGEVRLNAAMSVLKNAHKIMCSDDGVIGAFLNASCKKEAMRNLSSLHDAGWATIVTAAPKNGVVVALTAAPIPENDVGDDENVVDIVTTPLSTPTTLESIMTNQTQTTTNTNAQTNTAQQAQPQYVTIEQLQNMLNGSFAAIQTSATEAATKAAVAAAADIATKAAEEAVKKLKADLVTKTEEVATKATTAAEQAVKAELQRFDTKLAAAEAANKALTKQVSGLQEEAKKFSKKEKKAAKAEGGFMSDYTTGEKVVAAVAVGVVGWVIYDKFIKE